MPLIVSVIHLIIALTFRCWQSSLTIYTCSSRTLNTFLPTHSFAYRLLCCEKLFFPASVRYIYFLVFLNIFSFFMHFSKSAFHIFSTYFYFILYFSCTYAGVPDVWNLVNVFLVLVSRSLNEVFFFPFLFFSLSLSSQKFLNEIRASTKSKEKLKSWKLIEFHSIRADLCCARNLKCTMCTTWTTCCAQYLTFKIPYT